MAEISTGQMRQETVKVRNSRTDTLVDALIDTVSKDGQTLTVILAKNKIIFKPIPGKPGLWVANAHGMELTTSYKR
jgi:hypothetical protein